MNLTGSALVPTSTTYPSFRLSTSPGAVPRTYVHVQMIRSSTSSNDWKLNSAVWTR